MARKKRTRTRSRSRRRFSGVGLNTNLMLDVGIASLLVQKAPALANKLLFANNPVTGQTATLVGVGAAYLYGMLMKNNNVSNAGIALGIVDMVSPVVDQITSGLTDQITGGAMGVPGEYFVMGDYGTLSEYTNNPMLKQSNAMYRDSY